MGTVADSTFRNIYLLRELDDWFRAEAERQGRSINSLIVFALAKYRERMAAGHSPGSPQLEHSGGSPQSDQ